MDVRDEIESEKITALGGSGGSRDFALGWQRGGNRSRGGAEVRGAIYGKKNSSNSQSYNNCL